MTTDRPRRLADLARGLADLLATWWLGFDVTTADDPAPAVPDDLSSLDQP